MALRIILHGTETKNGKGIYILYSHSGKRYRLTTKLAVVNPSKNFNPGAKPGKWITGGPDKENNNLLLDQQFQEVSKWINDFKVEHNRRDPSVPEFMAQFAVKKSGGRDSKTLLGLFQQIIDKKSEILAPKSLDSYRWVKSKLEDFESAEGRNYKITEVNTDWYQSFVRFLEDEDYEVNSISVISDILKGAFNMMNDEQLAIINAYIIKKMSYSSKPVDKIYLTEDEVEQLYSVVAKTDEQALALDLMKIQIEAGCRDSDLRIDWVIDGSTLKFNPKKQFKKTMGRKPAIVFVTDRMRSVLEKYREGQKYTLPPMDRRKRNALMPALLQLAEIQTEVQLLHGIRLFTPGQVVKKSDLFTTHSCRKTYARIKRANGMQIDDIAASMGITVVTLLRNYLTETETAIVEAGKRAEETRQLRVTHIKKDVA